MSNKSQQLYDLGQSVWYDNIERKLLKNGKIEKMVNEGLIYGITSNPSIFNNAIANSSDYDADLLPQLQQGNSPVEIYESLAIDDIRAAAKLFLPIYEASHKKDGYVSLEVNPALAHDTEATNQEARRLWKTVGMPNLMVKIPATKAGVNAITTAIFDGINVNVTLIFSTARYEEVMDAYLAGLEARVQKKLPIDHITSVASFFISRIDSLIDQRLQGIIDAGDPAADEAKGLLGKVAVANAVNAYAIHTDKFNSARYDQLRDAGSQVQRPLWASTSTKNPDYSDVKYIEELIFAGTVNTVPPATLIAFEDHGTASMSADTSIAEALEILAKLESVGISMAEITKKLEDDGVSAFAAAFTELLQAISGRSDQQN